MIAVGERINGMFVDVKKAIQEQDKKVIQGLAIRQTKAGAKYLDVNVGTASADPATTMKWLVTTIQEVCDTPLALDSQRFSVIQAGLELAKGKIMINSSKGDAEVLDKWMPLAAKHNAALVCLTITKEGVPQDMDKRMEIAATIAERAMHHGLAMTDIFIDPIILPVNVAQNQPRFLLDVMAQVKCLSDPPPKTIIGLSNLSQGTEQRSLINRTFLVMAAAAGLEAAIVDVFDEELMDAWITAEMIMNKQIYSASYLKAGRM